MPRTDVTIAAPDGDCSATLHTPEGSGPWPAVIIFPDAGGVRDTFRTMADRLAGLGYTVLLPDVYYREGGFEPFDMATVFSDQEQRTRLMGMVGSLTNEKIVADAGAFLDFLAERPEVAGTGVGTTGYCMGGRASMLVAGSHPDRVAAAASFHGGRIAVEDDPNSPHLLADRLRATVYVAGAENDGSFTAEQAALLEDTLTKAGVAHTVVTYPAAHGFAVPDNPTYDAAAEQRHWEAMEELYGTALKF
ncbi:MAG: carboxymethylenebutenolidase [Pseudonocardiales bacterium]|jgi:carboxymethylenebutenolidase|uniref:dienelactone hydrolase family protein n=1 Tax=Pseudonocardia sp. TaxID=60912 RepID=UPI0026260678|nr:dienelactone hydrolase family protein [Pseudonocardia sp.]MCW2716820.1 Dienelactone hydrolase [Pseudonocardia sp.]MDT7618511.1 carboxymethylenebutenolidase [Pseudonocardiales bacterium]MDT7709110.1 carboxymethylenebutenolidase [Pseudonocardiales bacterium]